MVIEMNGRDTSFSVSTRGGGLLVVLSLILAALGAPSGLAQDAGEASVRWSSFVAASDQAGRRQRLRDAPAALNLPDSPWRCGVARPRRAAISEDAWSVQRVLACRRGEASVSATATCVFRGGEMSESAATLNLGTVGRDGHITVTLSCTER